MDKEKQQQDPFICCLQQTQFRYKDKQRLKMKGWEKIFLGNGNPK